MVKTIKSRKFNLLVCVYVATTPPIRCRIEVFLNNFKLDRVYM